jgi:hypothetical protein
MAEWQQMTLLSEPAKETIRTEKIEALASEMAGRELATVNEKVKVHRLNDKENELLNELLQVNYIFDVPNKGKDVCTP